MLRFLVVIAMLFEAALGSSLSSSSASAAAEASASSYSQLIRPYCPDVCTAEYDPQCAYNGQCYQTFGNKCEVLRTNCNLRPCDPKYEIVTCGRCEDYRCYRPLCRPQCPTACYLSYEPICAHNGRCYQTFGNNCFLGRYNCNNPNDYFEKRHDGECSNCEHPQCNM